MEIESPGENPNQDEGRELFSRATESIPQNLKKDILGDAPEPVAFDSWAARPAPRQRRLANRDRFDLDALKIFLILAGLTAGMALALRSLF